MRLFMILFYLALILIGVSFSALNADHVPINLYIKTLSLPLSLLIVISFGFGLLCGFLFSLLRYFRVKMEMTKTKNQLKICEKEIKNLRDIPLKDSC